jgi:hypothetical protein
MQVNSMDILTIIQCCEAIGDVHEKEEFTMKLVILKRFPKAVTLNNRNAYYRSEKLAEQIGKSLEWRRTYHQFEQSVEGE